MSKIKYLVVGAGLAGVAIAERIANVLKEEVLIIDRRDHIGGNIFDYEDNSGIFIHKYGPHAFHTNNKAVWDYLSRFTDWHLYFHRVEAVIEGINIPVPFNMVSLYKVFPKALAEKLENKLIQNFGYGKKIPILELKQTDDSDLNALADYIYNRIFLGYTVKQWGLRPEELDKSVTGRIPVITSMDDRYFQDKYQGIPAKGYTELIRNMLDNPLIKVELNTDFREIHDKIQCDKLIYTGAIDEFFNYSHGELPYRSLRFDLKELEVEYFQSKAQVNYPENYEFTRITEFKHFLNQKTNKTTIVYEYPEAYVSGKNDPYYPIPNQENDEKYRLYSEEAKKLNNVVFVGRLAEYRYYNMDQVVERALEIFENELLSKDLNTVQACQ